MFGLAPEGSLLCLPLGIIFFTAFRVDLAADVAAFFTVRKARETADFFFALPSLPPRFRFFGLLSGLSLRRLLGRRPLCSRYDLLTSLLGRLLSRSGRFANRLNGLLHRYGRLLGSRLTNALGNGLDGGFSAPAAIATKSVICSPTGFLGAFCSSFCLVSSMRSSSAGSNCFPLGAISEHDPQFIKGNVSVVVVPESELSCSMVPPICLAREAISFSPDPCSLG